MNAIDPNITYGDILGFFGTGIGAALAVLGAVYFEKWKSRRTAEGDRKLLVEALRARREEICDLGIPRDDSDYLLTSLHDAAAFHIQSMIDRLTDASIFIDEAKMSIVIEDFYVLDTVWRVKLALSECIYRLRGRIGEAMVLDSNPETWKLVKDNIDNHRDILVECFMRAEKRLAEGRHSW